MRGTISFVLELAPVVFGAVFLLATLFRSPREPPGLRLGMVACVGVFLALVGQRYLHQLEWRHGLAQLQPERVLRLEVDGHRVEDAGQVASVLRCLRETEWFSVNHGGFGRTVPLAVSLSDGRVLQFPVARSQREPGAIIAFVRPGAIGTWHDGYAFSRGLPEALAAAGAALP